MTLGPGLEPVRQGGERQQLLSFLARQRELVQWKLTGLSDDAARSVATSTGMSIHGIVRHLENVERSWWRDRYAGQEGLSFDWSDEDADLEFRVPDDVRLTDLLSSYRAETALCDEVVAAHDLDDVGAKTDHSLRWLVLHLVEEISRHVGHLDLLCELADGRTGEEPDA